MFRKPRDSPASIAAETSIRPSTGRPPTPPSTTDTHSAPSKSTSSSITYDMMSPSPLPLLGKAKTVSKKSPTTMGGKAKGKTNGNGNIMNFFKKAESQGACGSNTMPVDDSLFLEDKPDNGHESLTIQTPTPPRDDIFQNEVGVVEVDSPTSRYNEDAIPFKRRKVDERPDFSSESLAERQPGRGPFADDSDSGEDDGIRSIDGLQRNDSAVDINHEETLVKTPKVEEEEAPALQIRRRSLTLMERKETSITTPPSESKRSNPYAGGEENVKPHLKREATSIGPANDFDGIEDFIDDEFAEEGEEYLERRWMEEQAELELGLENDDEVDTEANDGPTQQETTTPMLDESESSVCPICGGNTASLTEQQKSIHVNDCLDGKAKPLPDPGGPNPEITETQITQEPPVPAHKRFQRAAIARPGQENPFGLASGPSQTSSAFSRLMSGHAEDAAWATAAASEQASRGKPAYQRTCPFYKIMPGFFICVDAFRYGAVSGCNAYFLSHFHSDHYIGLTSSWCHGPIYCSRVTGNLVRQQLRVDPKWVVDLKFDEKVEVPGTQGVDVTMIPANHCPGSSLFLFEKVVGKGKNPKIQRVLHCGDFRACPAHVQHPKLRPDIVDSVTGRNIAQQKLDVCYLDTTYLTPKYAFPSQENVIKACADMCVSLSKDFVDENDSWEQTKKEKAGDGMVKFVRKTSIKEELNEDNVNIKIEHASNPTDNKKPRGRLLVIIGTYSIGKERICLGVAKALSSKIYAPPAKQRICAALEDPELSARLTTDPLAAQVHMQSLMEIRAETLADYLQPYKPYFSRIVGFRPSGWNYRPPASRLTDSSISVSTVLHSSNWKSDYSMRELVPQRGSTREAKCFGVPYSEHSSFRELTMFVCALRIEKIVPTVNVGNKASRERMRGWCDRWAVEKKKNGLFRVGEGEGEGGW